MRHIALAILTVILVVLASQPIHGETSFTLTTGNDILAGNQLDDDLYTAALAATVRFKKGHVTFDERMFTDREANLRFDETWLLGGFRPKKTEQLRLGARGRRGAHRPRFARRECTECHSPFGRRRRGRPGLHRCQPLPPRGGRTPEQAAVASA